MKNMQEISREEAIEILARDTIFNDYDNKKFDRSETLALLHNLFNEDEGLYLTHQYIWSQEAEKLIKLNHTSQTYEKILAAGVLDDFKKGVFSTEPNSKYDDILVEWEKVDFNHCDNEALASELKIIGINVGAVVGEMTLFSCPCCGADTLPERHGWDICPVCWHEDSGFDNINSSYSYVGSDIGLHLYVQRINFIEHGISRPDRHDLIKIKEPIENYNQGRIFEIDRDKKIIFEKNTNWFAPLTPPSFDEHIKRLLTLPTMELAMTIANSYFSSVNLDFSCLWHELEKKVATEGLPASQEKIACLKESIGQSSLLQQKFSEILGLSF